MPIFLVNFFVTSFFRLGGNIWFSWCFRKQSQNKYLLGFYSICPMLKGRIIDATLINMNSQIFIDNSKCRYPMKAGNYNRDYTAGSIADWRHRTTPVKWSCIIYIDGIFRRLSDVHQKKWVYLAQMLPTPHPVHRKLPCVVCEIRTNDKIYDTVPTYQISNISHK